MPHPRLRRRPVPGAWALVAVGLLTAWRWWRAPPDAGSLDPTRTYRAVAVEQGDTLVLEEGQRVRLIGVRSLPAAERSNWLQRAVTGQALRMEFDRQRIGAEGALLAYVFAGDTLLNVEFLRAGLGRLDESVSLRPDRQRALQGASR